MEMYGLFGLFSTQGDKDNVGIKKEIKEATSRTRMTLKMVDKMASVCINHCQQKAMWSTYSLAKEKRLTTCPVQEC